jgi:hypothetical protein
LPRPFYFSLGVVFGLVVAGCGPADGGGLDLQIRFARMEQAQTDARGLPLGVHSYIVQARTGGPDGDLAGGTDCINIGADDDKRMSVKLDLPAHRVVSIVVSAYGGTGCTGGLDWQGLAACDAVLYDPSTATFSTPIPLATGCRGLHRALKLSDGRVLVVGGTRQAVVDFNGTVTVRPSGDQLVTTAEVFDPATNQFSPAGSSADIGRADAAAVAMTDDKVVLMGGRTIGLKSDDIVAGLPGGDTWNFSVAGTSLLTPRSGARAARLTAGILVVGGNAPGTEPVERLDPVSFTPSAVSLSTTAPLCVFGHSLTQLNGIEALIAGGVPDDAGALPGDSVVSISLGDNPPTMWEGSLQHPRAFHAASLLQDGRVLLAGGLDDTLAARKDLEVLTPGGSSQVLTEATLQTESMGMAVALLPDGSVVLAGGLDLEAGGVVKLSSVVQLLSP